MQQIIKDEILSELYSLFSQGDISGDLSLIVNSFLLRQKEIKPKASLQLTHRQDLSILRINGIYSNPIESEYDTDLEKFSGTISFEQLNSMLVNNSETKKNLLISINSPGGSSLQSSAIFDYLMSLKDKGITIHSIINNLGCSAAYETACAGDQILASPTSIAGNIGALYVYKNLSKFYEELGIKFKEFAFPEGKVFPSPLKEIDNKDTIELTNFVKEAAMPFMERVANRRNLSIEQILALNGRWFPAEKALKLGLIDGIMTESQFIEQFEEEKIKEKNEENIQVPVLINKKILYNLDKDKKVEQNFYMTSQDLEIIQNNNIELNNLKNQIFQIQNENLKVKSENSLLKDEITLFKQEYVNRYISCKQKINGTIISEEEKNKIFNLPSASLVELTKEFEIIAQNKINAVQPMASLIANSQSSTRNGLDIAELERRLQERAKFNGGIY